MRGWFSTPPDVAEIIPGLLIGSAPDARAVRSLAAHSGITHVVDLTEGAVSNGAWPETFAVEHHPLREYQPPGLGELSAVAARVAELVGSGHEAVLVHCREGVQRAPLVACAALVRMGWPLADAVRLVRERRPVTDISEAQLAVLATYSTGEPQAAGSLLSA